MPIGDLVAAAERRGGASIVVRPRTSGAGGRRNAEFAAIAMLIADWDSIAPWLAEELFDDEANRRAFAALVAAGGDLAVALDGIDSVAADVLESASVTDVDGEPVVEARNLIAAATRRALRRRVTGADPDRIATDATARLTLEDLADPARADEAAAWLLGWLIDGRGESDVA